MSLYDFIWRDVKDDYNLYNRITITNIMQKRKAEGYKGIGRSGDWENGRSWDGNR